MEFPDLGKHCHEATCNRLDFLPLKCDSCDHVYCSTHFQYERHACKGQRKDAQVPICPLCGKPVPTPPDTAPDITVGRHIDEQCKSDQKKIFTNRCSQSGCKRKELIPVTCTECGRNFCLRHRHTADHKCEGRMVTSTNDQRAMAAKAAENRRTSKLAPIFNIRPNRSAATSAPQQRMTSSQVQNIQGNMTEDEALAHALALSIYELDESANQNRDEGTTSNVAQRNASSVRVGGRERQPTNDKDKCAVS